MIKIIITDDHYLIREGFKKSISKEPDMEVVGEAANASETLKLLMTTNCDILVLDISLPGKSGIDLIKDLEELHPEIKILIMSIHPEERYGMRVLQSNASGYIEKDSSPEELIKAIRLISKGKRYTSEVMSEKIISNIGRESYTELHEKLSDREFEILMKIGKGESLTAISKDLNLSISTVNTYRNRILSKLNKKTNAELIHYVVKNGLIE
jgi:DNA-binding NarL/FixJ family response regulator